MNFQRFINYDPTAIIKYGLTVTGYRELIKTEGCERHEKFRKAVKEGKVKLFDDNQS